MVDFTIELNRDQSDAVSVTVNKTSPNGLAFTFAFDQNNTELVSNGQSPLSDEPTYLKGLLVGILQSWRSQQLNEGVSEAYKNADESTKATVRSTLGL